MRNAIALTAAAIGSSTLVALSACGASTSTAHVRHHAAPTVAVSTTAAPTPGAAACAQASTLGHDIAYGYAYSGTDYPTVAVLRSWHSQLSALVRAASVPMQVPADAAEFGKIDSDAVEIGFQIIPAIYTGFGNSPPVPVRSVNWNAAIRYAAMLQFACGA